MTDKSFDTMRLALWAIAHDCPEAAKMARAALDALPSEDEEPESEP